MEKSEPTMTRIIITKGGRKLRRQIKPISELDQAAMRNAMVNCGTKDDAGNYVDIRDVKFIPSTQPIPKS